MSIKRLEDVFVTEGVPQYTFIPPPNFNDILIDVRKEGKPVIIEGQSGTGKTTCIKKIIEKLSNGTNVQYLTARQPTDIQHIKDIVSSRPSGTFVIDDLHRLSPDLQRGLAEIAKVAAEVADPSAGLPKLILIGINEVGSSLIQLVSDIAKRVGIHRINPGSPSDIESLISKGSEALGITIQGASTIYNESAGDYWLSQRLCQTICMMNDVIETVSPSRVINFNLQALRTRVVEQLKSAYYSSVKEFCRGTRFRPSNDPYYKLLRAISGQGSSIVDLNTLANSTPDVRGSINNIKDHRLSVLLHDKQTCGQHFYYNVETKNFVIEDPALLYFLKHLDWEILREDCGFKVGGKDFEFDFAISFAGENREFAKYISEQLRKLDVSVFYDELYESNYLGQTWSVQFKKIFSEDSRLVLCILDKHHKAKIWPTFERECFDWRVKQGDVIPIYLDDTVFVGIPRDLIGFKFSASFLNLTWKKEADDIVLKLWERLSQ